MPTRHLVIVRHAAADAFGELTTAGQQQAELLGRRLAPLPIATIWHSPRPRAQHTARLISAFLPHADVAESTALDEFVPHVAVVVRPGRSGSGADGADRAAALLRRFARPAPVEVHELVITHAPQVAWLVRDALGLPPARWIDVPCGNAAVTVIGYRDAGPPEVLLCDDRIHLPAHLR
jgi:probable phosphoglycerate mutase